MLFGDNEKVDYFIMYNIPLLINYTCSIEMDVEIQYFNTLILQIKQTVGRWKACIG